MKQKKTIFFLSVAAIFFAALFVFFFSPSKVNTPQEPALIKNRVVGVVVPHHAPVFSLIDEVLQKVDWQPKRIILLGPNHKDAGGARVITGIFDRNQKQIFDEKYIQNMIRAGFAKQDDVVLAEEHSIGVPLASLRQYFPEAQFVPIILSSENKQKESEQLANFLLRYLDAQTLVVASIDFSHYLHSDLTGKKDQETLEAIRTRDFSKMENFKSDYLDSPGSIMTLLLLLDKTVPTQMEVVRNTNSGLFAGEPIESWTSYITMIFRLSQ